MDPSTRAERRGDEPDSLPVCLARHPLGDTIAALLAVEALKSQPTFFSVLNLWSPALDPIREHPRFRSTLEQLGLPFRGTEP
jgi:hypothetical protein